MKFNFNPISDNERKEIENDTYKDYIKEKEEVVYKSTMTYYNIPNNVQKSTTTHYNIPNNVQKSTTTHYNISNNDQKSTTTYYNIQFKKKLKYKHFDKGRNISNIS